MFMFYLLIIAKRSHSNIAMKKGIKKGRGVDAQRPWDKNVQFRSSFSPDR
jgi:hypothetical protein